MARKQFLQNVHTTKKYSPEVIAAAQLKDGEIAVFQNTEEPSLAIKVGETYAQFKDSSAVTKEITIVKNDLQGKIDAINGDSGALKNYLKSEDADKKFETKADASTKKTEAISSAKSYTDAEITKLTGDTAGSLQKQITENKTAIKGNSDKITELSAGTTAYTTTAVSNAKTELIGTTADTKDIKTIEGTRKYAESLATKITGSTTGSIGARLKAVENKATANASNISTNTQGIKALQGTDKDLSSSVSIVGAKKYADEKIAKAVSSVYKVKGTCTYVELPASGEAIGDVWNVTDTHDNVPAGTNYVWTDKGWDALAGTVDLSPYFKTVDFNTTLTADTSFTSVKDTAEAAATKTELAAVKKTADAAAVKTDVDTALKSKVAKSELGTYATQKGIQDALDKKTDKTNFEALEKTVNVITGTTLNGYVKTGATSDKKDEMTGYGLRAYANDAVSTAKATLEGKSDSTSATTTIIGAKKYADAVVKALSDGQVSANTQSISNNAQSITDINGRLTTTSSRANSAIQRITIKANADAGVKISEPTGGDGKKTQELDFSAIVIDCGKF